MLGPKNGLALCGEIYKLGAGAERVNSKVFFLWMGTHNWHIVPFSSLHPLKNYMYWATVNYNYNYFLIQNLNYNYNYSKIYN